MPQPRDSRERTSRLKTTGSLVGNSGAAGGLAITGARVGREKSASTTMVATVVTMPMAARTHRNFLEAVEVGLGMRSGVNLAMNGYHRETQNNSDAINAGRQKKPEQSKPNCKYSEIMQSL